MKARFPSVILLILSAVPAFSREPVPDRLVVLTFDDASRSHYTVARALLKKYGFGATFFVTEGFDFPANAARYKAAGINLYVGLWRGPTEEQLAALKKHGLRVICAQNAAGLRHKDDPTIVGWMHGDEPDNAQSLGRILEARDGAFRDDFAPWDVHLYKIKVE